MTLSNKRLPVTACVRMEMVINLNGVFSSTDQVGVLKQWIMFFLFNGYSLKWLERWSVYIHLWNLPDNHTDNSGIFTFVICPISVLRSHSCVSTFVICQTGIHAKHINLDNWRLSCTTISFVLTYVTIPVLDVFIYVTLIELHLLIYVTIPLIEEAFIVNQF